MWTAPFPKLGPGQQRRELTLTQFCSCGLGCDVVSSFKLLPLILPNVIGCNLGLSPNKPSLLNCCCQSVWLQQHERKLEVGFLRLPVTHQNLDYYSTDDQYPRTPFLAIPMFALRASEDLFPRSIQKKLDHRYVYHHGWHLVETRWCLDVLTGVFTYLQLYACIPGHTALMLSWSSIVWGIWDIHIWIWIYGP